MEPKNVKDYTYEASTIGNNTWIVRRFDKDNLCQEAEVFNASDKQHAIDLAIRNGSWA